MRDLPQKSHGAGGKDTEDKTYLFVQLQEACGPKAPFCICPEYFEASGLTVEGVKVGSRTRPSDMHCQ